MFCETCGFEIEEDDSFCRKCGKSVGGSAAVEPAKRCERLRDGRMVTGICAGCASYFEKDVTVIRIAWVLAALIPPLFPGLVAYVICWLLMPVSSDPETGEQQPVSEAVISE